MKTVAGLNLGEIEPTSQFQGLVNEGMTCYLNSMLQALYSLGAFRKIIYEHEKKSDDENQE